MDRHSSSGKLSNLYEAIKQSLQGKETDYTQGSIKRSVVLLAIPMMLEMVLESVFALVDLYFVGHLPESSASIQTVGLTESVLTILYSLAVGMSMAATAVVARRVGEKNPEEASKAGMQAIIISVFITILLSAGGVIFGTDILLLMGASREVAVHGTPFIKIMLSGSVFIVLLFLINGIFRGAGNAAIAMKSLWIANILNIVLCPVLINGLGPIPAFGLTGAAIATTIGRGLGVCYQLYHLLSGKGILKVKLRHFIPDQSQIFSLIKIATPGVFQFVVASCSWIFLAQLVATTGGDNGSAGYQTALRLMMFFMLPAWGLSNAASTLVGQNLGALHPERAEQSVIQTAKYNIVFMAIVSVLTFAGANIFVSFFTNDPEVQKIAVKALHIISSGFIIYGMGMVLVNTFNGAGDTWTPTWINLCAFWLFQIPLAYILSKLFEMGPTGVFISIPVAESLITITGFILFKKGRWKKVRV